MKKTLLTGVAALFLATGAAHAKDLRRSILPPPQFDHLYEGQITIRHDSAWSLPCRPRSLAERLGCTFLEEDEKNPPAKECFIWLALKKEIEEAGYTENIIFRRQMALCNGWKGYRRLPYEMKSDREMDKELEKILKDNK